LGRLVLVANSDGSAIAYSHDESGNVVSISNWTATTQHVAGFMPEAGHAGTPITIYGNGFSPTPAQNAITIGGVSASVSGATSTTLFSVIPQGAVTGPIAVTVNGVTATSLQNVVVYRPVISGFTPTLVNPGGAVTLTGDHFNRVPGSASITVTGAGATINLLTNTQAAFAAPTNGGTVTISTSYGSATSTSILTVVPSAISVAHVLAHAVVQSGGIASLSVPQSNRYALLELDLAANQYASIQVSTLSTTPSSASVPYQVFSPSGSAVKTGTVSASNRTIHLPLTPATGRYLVSFASGSSTSVNINAAVEVDATLNTAGTAQSVAITVSGQSKRVVATLSAGDDLGLGLTGVSRSPSSPNYLQFEIYQPNGALLDSFNCVVPSCSRSLLDAPSTGMYTIVADPGSVATGSFTATFSHALSGSLTPGAAPSTVDLSVVGRRAYLSFDATAGQTFALNFGSITTTPSGKIVRMRVYGPSGTQLADVESASGDTVNLEALGAGTHMALVHIEGAFPGMAQLKLVNGLAGALPTTGTSQNFGASVPGQNGYFTFDAIAGDDLAIALTGLSLTPTSSNITVKTYRPNGTELNSFNVALSQNPGGSASLLDVPATGTYSVKVDPAAFTQATYTLTVSQAITGTLVPSATPLTLDLTVPARRGYLDFTATAGQSLSLQLSAISTTPSGRQITARVYNSSGTQIGTVSSETGATLNLSNLTAGTHMVLLHVDSAAAGTVQVRIP
jgi:hypothetical protein